MQCMSSQNIRGSRSLSGQSLHLISSAFTKHAAAFRLVFPFHRRILCQVVEDENDNVTRIGGSSTITIVHPPGKLHRFLSVVNRDRRGTDMTNRYVTQERTTCLHQTELGIFTGKRQTKLSVFNWAPINRSYCHVRIFRHFRFVLT